MKARKTPGKKGRTLYIKNPAAHRLAEQYSKRLGVTLSDAVITALQDSLRSKPKRIDREKVEALCAQLGELPVVDSRSPDEILGYDAFGIPR